ncbi:hypothetical protein ACX27_21360 [Nostoc piscinale CENA21]|uniref:Uncharacterized protein n=1 Tax=Nostoc piscinale CENA21 TaxID=224013 RepID=A0A0M4TMS5_9NOSO|nr:hypothetical protein [Nostoc piscinale]ALF54799.1 hypothetical protein ACX27_21360 [Nostoc piscinale CENA21]
MDTVNQELIKALIGFIPTLIGLLLAWQFGTRISVAWNLRQKRRESVLEAVHTFQLIYGKWFAIAKTWNLHLSRKPDESNNEAYQAWLQHEQELLGELLKLEGDLEALLLKLSCQYTLNNSITETIERFREGFQVLRRTMWERQGISWFAYPEGDYSSFKILAARIVNFLTCEELVTDRGQEVKIAERNFFKSNFKSISKFVEPGSR